MVKYLIFLTLFLATFAAKANGTQCQIYPANRDQYVCHYIQSYDPNAHSQTFNCTVLDVDLSQRVAIVSDTPIVGTYNGIIDNIGVETLNNFYFTFGGFTSGGVQVQVFIQLPSDKNLDFPPGVQCVEGSSGKIPYEN